MDETEKSLNTAWQDGYAAGYEQATLNIYNKIREMFYEVSEMRFSNSNADILYQFNLDGTRKTTTN